MKTHAAHPNTLALMEAWKRLAENDAAALDGPIASDYPGIVDRLFILQRASKGDYSFRTAGDEVQRLAGRDLTDQNFLGLWHAPDRALVDAALETVIADRGPTLIHARGETLHGRTIGIEIALAPLNLGRSEQRTRLLGIYQPLVSRRVLGERPVFSHKVLSIHPPAPERVRPRLRIVASNG